MIKNILDYKFCPITGFSIVTPTKWSNISNLTSDGSVILSIIDNSILHVTISGTKSISLVEVMNIIRKTANSTTTIIWNLYNYNKKRTFINKLKDTNKFNSDNTHTVIYTHILYHTSISCLIKKYLVPKEVNFKYFKYYNKAIITALKIHNNNKNLILNKDVCPITNLKIHSNKSWEHIKVGENYSVTFKRIGESILFATGFGESETYNADRYFSAREDFIDKEFPNNSAFIEIRDLQFATGKPNTRERNIHTKYLENDGDRLLGFYLFNVNPLIKLVYNVGLKFIDLKYPLKIFDSYEQTIQIAIKELNKGNSYSDIEDNLHENHEISVFSDDIEKLAHFIGNIAWNHNNLEIEDNIDSFLKKDSSLSELFLALQVMQNDYQELRKEQKNREYKLAKAVKKANEANILKSNFVATMSHEIRTPMNGILGMLSFLNDTKLNEEQSDYVNTAILSGDRLLALLNDILDISKIEAKSISLENIPFDLVELINNIYSLSKKAATEKNISLGIRTLFHNNSSGVLGDPIRLNQILTNLISNALKFTPNNGKVTTIIEVIETNEDNVKVQFSITDTGIGISHDNQNKLFTSFQQADSSITRKYGGTGLGLAISQNLVSLMGGKITVKSSENNGSTFSFEIDLKICKEYKSSSFKNKSDYNISSFDDYNVLLVEDNNINQIVAKKMLEKLNISVTIAENGKIACDKVKESHYNLILMDIEMPVMDGFMATESIRKYELEFGRDKTPIIAMSANALDEHKRRAKEVGMDNYITKPVSIDIISKTLNDLIN